MALRWLAGGNYDDIRLVAGCSVMSLFRLLCTHGKLCSQSLQTCQISDVCWERQALEPFYKSPNFHCVPRQFSVWMNICFAILTWESLVHILNPAPSKRKRVSPFRSIHKTNCCDNYSWSQLEKMDDCPHLAVNNILRPSFNTARKK